MEHFQATQNLTQKATPDSFITLYCYFVYDGAPVDVDNPTAEFFKEDDTPVTVTVVKPLSKIREDNHIYSVNFIPHGLEAGNYKVKFSGQYEGEEIVVWGSFSLQEVPVLQHYIYRLRTMLADKYVELYNLDPPEFRWNDGQLAEFIFNAVDAFNAVNPTTSYDLESAVSAGYGWLILQRAEYEALFSRYILEIVRDFNYSDGLSLSFDRGSKYADAAQKVLDEWKENVEKVKAAKAFSKKWRGLIDFPVPVTVAYMMSFIPGYENVFGIYGWWYI